MLVADLGGEVRLNVLLHVGPPDFSLTAVGVGIVRVVGVETDERHGDDLLVQLHARRYRRFRVHEIGELRWFADVHELRDPEREARIIDERMPAQLDADVLNLHADLSHLPPQLVIDEPFGVVAYDEPLAAGVGHLRDGAEGGLEISLDFARQLVALRAHVLVGDLSRTGASRVEREARGRRILKHGGGVGAGVGEAELDVAAVLVANRGGDVVLRAYIRFRLADRLQRRFGATFGQRPARTHLDQLDGPAWTQPDVPDRRSEERIEFKEILAVQVD